MTDPEQAGSSPERADSPEEILDPWSWGRVVTPDGDYIPPGACDGMHNKDQQRELLGR